MLPIFANGSAIKFQRLRTRLFCAFRNKYLLFIAKTWPVPRRDLVPPPQLPRDAPGLDVFHPVEIGVLPVLGDELGLVLAHGFDRRLRQGLGVDVPLPGQIRLDHHVGAVAVRHHVGVAAQFSRPGPCLQAATRSPCARQSGQDLKLLGLFEFARETAPRRGSVIFVLRESLAFDTENIDLRQVMPLANLEVVEVVRRRDLHRARALLGIGVLVADDRDLAPHQRQDHVLADQVLVALVLRVHGHRRVAQHRLGPRGGDHDEGRRIVRVEGLALERIAQVPEMPLALHLHHFEVGDGGQELWVPVDQPFVLVDETGPIKLHENFKNRLGQPLVHGETLARPVARSAQALELVDDGAAQFGLPGPHPLEELFPPHLAAAGLAALGQLPLDHHLGGDAGMVGARLPQHVLAAHALEAAEDILQRVVERMAHMQRAGDVGRRNDDRIRFGLKPFGPAGAEGFRLLPSLVNAALDLRGLIGLFDHFAVLSENSGAQGAICALQSPPRPPESTCPPPLAPCPPLRPPPPTAP